MPVVFVIAEEWKLRAGVRAELRERGIKALGMENAAEVGGALAEGESPSALVLDANAAAASDPAVQKLVRRVPTVLIVSRTSSIPVVSLKESSRNVILRPVQIGEVVRIVMEILAGAGS